MSVATGDIDGIRLCNGRISMECYLPAMIGYIGKSQEKIMKQVRKTDLSKTCAYVDVILQLRQGRIQSLSLGGGAHVERPSPPLPTTPIPPLPPSFPPLSLPVLPLRSLSFPSLLPFAFLSLSSPPFPFPPLPLKRESGGPPPENFEILDCCR